MCERGKHASYHDIIGYFDPFVIKAGKDVDYYQRLNEWAACGCMVKVTEG